MVNIGTEEHNGWHDPDSRIKTLKKLGAVGGLFLVSFLPLSGWKQVSLFSKQVKMVEVAIPIVTDISFSPSIHRYHNINITIHHLFDVLLHP